MVNLGLVKLYFGEYLVYGFEIIPLSKWRGKCLFGITWDYYTNYISLYIDFCFKNVLEKEIKRRY